MYKEKKMSFLNSAWEEYKTLCNERHWPIEQARWMGISFVLAVCAIALIWGVSTLISFQIESILLFTLFFVILDLMIGYPYLKAQKRIDQIEESLPDALKQMADTLKAGGTFEYELRGISTAQYGPLTSEMNNILRRLEEGENLANSMKAFSRNVSSRIVKRSINIILDSIESGASLADILD